MKTLAEFKLYGELCAELNLNENDRKKLETILKKYQVKSLAGYESFDECQKKFLNAKICKNLSSITITNYTMAINKFHKYIGNTCPANLTVDNIRSYIVHLKDTEKLQPSSIQQNLGVLKNFFTWMEGENLILENIFARIEKPKVNMRTRHSLTDTQVSEIRKNLNNDRDNAMIEFFLNTGCRLSEVSNLTLDKINFTNNSAIVTGKGNKTRTVFFDKKTAGLLTSYLTDKPKTTNNYVFTTRNKNNSKLKNSTIQSTMHKLGLKSGVRLYPHILRHTFATSALERGMDIVTIQHLLGYNDVGTTQIYAETSNSMLEKQYNKIFA